MWSAETEELGRNYHIWYGFTQGFGVSAVLVWVSSGFEGGSAPRT